MPIADGVNWETVYLGKSRYYRNPETGEMLSRRAFDRLRGMPSFEARAKQSATALGVSLEKKRFPIAGTTHRVYRSKNLESLYAIFLKRVGKAYGAELRMRIGKRWYSTPVSFIPSPRTRADLSRIWDDLARALERLIISYKGRQPDEDEEEEEPSENELLDSADIDEFALVLIS